MTGTSSEARTLAIRLRYSTASLKLCLQKEKEKALPLVAEDNGHTWTIEPTKRVDKYWQFAYGNDMEDKNTINAEDEFDGQESARARMEVEQLKIKWERAELGELAQRNVELKHVSYTS